MERFQINVPTKVFFGREITESALKQNSELISGNILIVTTGRSLRRLGYIDQLIQILKSLENVKSVIISGDISANPRVSEVNEIIENARNKNINLVIGFGGGSAIDAAKAAAVGIGAHEKIDDYFYKGKEPSDKTLPIIAIPTTAGTGSELSKAAILSDPERTVKGGVRGTNIYPKIALVDPNYTDSVPLKTTMETGFDVLAHAVESYVSKKSSAFTQIFSEKAVSIVGEYLPRLYENLHDVEARDQMSYASMTMGINLGNASTALPHRMQYPIGAHTDTSHGCGLAILYPAWISYEYDYSQEKVKRVLELLTGCKPTSKEEAINQMCDFEGRIGVEKRLTDIGIKQGEVQMLTDEVTGNIANDPASEADDVIKKIYQMSM